LLTKSQFIDTEEVIVEINKVIKDLPNFLALEKGVCFFVTFKYLF